MTATPRQHPSPARRARTPGAVRTGALALALLALLAACSASSGGGSDSAADSGGSVAEAAGGSADGSATDVDAGDARQVVQTGTVAISVDDPRAAADTVADLADRAGGRVDDRTEHAATDVDSATAQLTIRVPAAEVTDTLDALRDLGTITTIDLQKKDVTAAAEDLDARIRALRLSVARMEDLLSRATDTAALVAAENALTERQSSLEQLEAQRAQLADQVSLSTITITLAGPGVVVTEEPGPTTFLAGLETGWNAFLALVRWLVVVIGVLLPWLAFGGAAVAAGVATRRWWRARHPERATPAPGPQPFLRTPMPAYVTGATPAPTTPPPPAEHADPARPAGAADEPPRTEPGADG